MVYKMCLILLCFDYTSVSTLRCGTISAVQLCSCFPAEALCLNRLLLQMSNQKGRKKCHSNSVKMLLSAGSFLLALGLDLGLGWFQELPLARNL
jgi:hypothetical protein